MTLLERINTTPPPEVLYHYTTQTGLLGILQDNCLWATTADYLNDASEYSYGIGLIEAALKERSRASTRDEERINLDGIARGLSKFMTICVVSLTMEGDLLSQWRAYAGGSGGFALGMRAEHLRDVAHQHGFYLVECLYTPADQQRAISELIDEFLKRMGASEEWNLADQGGCVATATRLAMMLKDESFAEEREWRLISRPKMIREMDFRRGTSTLVPFFKLPLGPDRNAYLDSVRTGPTPHPELATASVHMLLQKLGLSDPTENVKRTRIPYRNW